MIALESVAPEQRPAAIAEAAARLRDAAHTLRARPAERVLDSVCTVLDQWCDPRSQWRRALLEQLPETTGFAPDSIATGLELGLGGWNGDALRALVARELGPEGLGANARAMGFDLTSVLLAGTIPSPTLLSLLLPLVLRSAVLAKPASRDPHTPALVHASIAEVDAELGRCLEVVGFPGEDRAAAHAFLEGDCVVATGSDTTVAEISQQLRASKRLVRYGHRLSVAVLGPEAQRAGALPEIARRLAVDIALWDQLGCLSPAALFVCSDEPELSRRTAAALASALAEREEAWPRAAVSPQSAAAIRGERADAEVRALRSPGIEIHSRETSRWTVIAEADASWRPSPLHRFLRVHPVTWSSSGDSESLHHALGPIAPHLSAVVIDGFGEAEAAVVRELEVLGATRICRPGRAQAPPLDWHHDGMPVLLPLARICDLELSTPAGSGGSKLPSEFP